MLQAASTRHGAGTEDFTRVQPRGSRSERNHVLETMVHVGAGSSAHLVSVDSRGHLELVGVTDFVGRHDPGPEDIRVRKVLALTETESGGDLLELSIAGAEIVEDGVTEDMRRGIRA